MLVVSNSSETLGSTLVSSASVTFEISIQLAVEGDSILFFRRSCLMADFGHNAVGLLFQPNLLHILAKYISN